MEILFLTSVRNGRITIYLAINNVIAYYFYVCSTVKRFNII